MRPTCPTFGAIVYDSNSLDYLFQGPRRAHRSLMAAGPSSNPLIQIAYQLIQNYGYIPLPLSSDSFDPTHPNIRKHYGKEDLFVTQFDISTGSLQGHYLLYDYGNDHDATNFYQACYQAYQQFLNPSKGFSKSTPLLRGWQQVKSFIKSRIYPRPYNNDRFREAFLSDRSIHRAYSAADIVDNLSLFPPQQLVTKSIQMGAVGNYGYLFVFILLELFKFAPCGGDPCGCEENS
ncbi:MAG: hypothetical protein U0003_03870 [Vampirovibrionales bacterium]